MLTKYLLGAATSRYSLAMSSCYMSTEITSSAVTPKPYSAIPKKKGFMKFFDYFGPKPHDVVFKRIKELGPLYREKVPSPMPELLMVCDPKDVETVVRADGKWPLRDAIPQWGEAMKTLNIPENLVVIQEYEEWHRQRKPMSKFMMVPRKVGESHQGLNEVTHDLILAIQKLRNSDTNTVKNFIDLLYKWSFESASYFVLGKRMGALYNDNIPKDCLMFIDYLNDFFNATHKLMVSLPTYKIYPTKAWKSLVSSYKGQYEIALKYVGDKLKDIKENDEQIIIDDEGEIPEQVDFLTYMIHKGEMSIEEITTNAIALLGAGVDTTSYTLSWTLYCLATNHDVQTKLRNEIMSVVGKEEIVTPEHIRSLTYLRQCIKESQRMYPIAATLARTLNKDVTLSGYNVPKGTPVMIQNRAMGWLPHLFPEPEIYRPERWAREVDNDSSVNQFASLPFGFGPRMCVGRRLVELELNIALAHIIKTFTVDFPDAEPMEPSLNLLLIPGRELNLTFKDI